MAENGGGYREGLYLLSRFATNPTVGGLRGEKEKRSTRGRLCVDSGIGSFFKLLEVGFSPYLRFILILSVFDVSVSLRP